MPLHIGTVRILNALFFFGHSKCAIFFRLAKDTPGYLNFAGHYDKLFTLLLSSLKIELGVDHVMAATNSHVLLSITQIIVYSFGVDSDNKFASKRGVRSQKKKSEGNDRRKIEKK